MAEHPHTLNWKKRLILGLGSRILRLWFSTCRVKIVGEDLHTRHVLTEGTVVGATWHRNALFLVWFFRKAHPMVMFSRSRDGEWIAGFAERLGIVPVRGSSSRGGTRALKTMLEHMKRPGGGKTATVLDGPRGPKYVAKPGMILLAKEAGAPLLPVAVSARPAITLKKTWDRTMIPLPFSRIVVTYREPWTVPKDLDKDGLERLRLEVENTLKGMTAQADRLTGYDGG
jgi:lysophospholipid acyltransferase (LPLAT)-like uncharacterized protein